MEKQRILKELKESGFIKFTCKYLEISDIYAGFIDIKITEVNNNYIVWFSDSETEKTYSIDRLNSLLDYIIRTCEIYFK